MPPHPNPSPFSCARRYVICTVKGSGKKTSLRTKTYNDGGLDVNLDREIFTFWCDEESMFNGVKVDVWDDDIGRDDLMASATLDLFQYSAAATEILEPPRDLLYHLRKGGELVACMEFFPVVNLQIAMYEGRDIHNPNMLGKTFDPYLMFTSKSRAGVKKGKKKEEEKGGKGNLSLRGKTHSNGSKTPNWEGEELYGMLCDHRFITVVCYDDDVGKVSGVKARKNALLFCPSPFLHLRRRRTTSSERSTSTCSSSSRRERWRGGGS